MPKQIISSVAHVDHCGCGICGTTFLLDIRTEELEKIFVFIALDKDAVKRAEAAGFNAVLNEPLGPVDLQDTAASMDIFGNVGGPWFEGPVVSR